MRRALLATCSSVGLFAAVTWWALESHDVAVIETHQADGQIRKTHVWWVAPDGQLWLEAGSPSNGWFVDIGADPRIVIQQDDSPIEFVGMPFSDATHHGWIRSVIREKYGFRDWWVNLLVDTSESVAVRLIEAENLISQE